MTDLSEKLNLDDPVLRMAALIEDIHAQVMDVATEMASLQRRLRVQQDRLSAIKATLNRV